MIKKRKSSFSLHLSQSRRRQEVAALRRRLCEEETRKGSEEEEKEESEAQRILRKLRKSQATYVRERTRRGDCWVPTQKIPRYELQ